MSTSKHINLICLAACFVTLLLTILFMNGRAFGLTAIVDGDAGDGQFTANDRNADWDRNGAAQITLTGDSGSVKGNGAYISGGDVHILYAGTYILSGELSDGSVIIEAGSKDKIWLLLDGVSLHCEDSAALLVEQAGKVFLTLAGRTENTISSGAAYKADAVSAGIDGAVYSRDDLTVNGSGALRVTGGYRHGIVCNDDLVITGGTIDITAAQDGIHANDSARFMEASITITAGDDGVSVSNDEGTGYIYVESGSISIPSCYEGFEAIDITIAGGTLDIRPTDDGINANGQGESRINISGGDITIINETGHDADGLDSNGDIEISGGRLLVSVNGSGSNAAIDYGSENGGTCLISGGTVVAAGGSMMAEGFDSASEQCFISYTTAGTPAGTEVTLKNTAGKVLLSEVVPCSFSFLAVSTPELQIGETYTLSIGGTEENIIADNTTDSPGMAAMAGMPGNRGGGKIDWGFGGQPDKNDMGDAPPDIPDGGFGQDAMHGMPDGRMPIDGGAQQGEFTHGGQDSRGQFMQRGQEQGRPQGDAAVMEAVISPAALMLVGVSVLFLLAGIAAAFKVKH